VQEVYTIGDNFNVFRWHWTELAVGSVIQVEGGNERPENEGE
jgi:hypothetical protein